MSEPLPYRPGVAPAPPGQASTLPGLPWLGTARLFQPGNPAFYVWVLGIVVGGSIILSQAVSATLSYPMAAALAVILLVLYTLPFMGGIVRLDLVEPEPRSLRAAAFLWGGLAGTGLALVANQAMLSLITKQTSLEFAATWGPAIAGATNEELLKGAGILLVAALAGRELDNTLDGLVYGALVGLGFQVVENFVYAVNSVALTGGANQVTPVLGTLFLRCIVVGLYSHATYSAIVGAGIGYAWSRRDLGLPRRVAVGLLGLFAGWLLHFVWNSPLFNDLYGYGLLGVLGVLLIKGLPGVLLVTWLYRRARVRDLTWFRAALAPEVARGTLTQQELDVLCSLRARRRVAKAVGRSHGRQAKRAVRDLMREHTSLALDVVDPSPEATARAQQRRVRAAQLRLQLAGRQPPAPPSLPPGYTTP